MLEKHIVLTFQFLEAILDVCINNGATKPDVEPFTPSTTQIDIDNIIDTATLSTSSKIVSIVGETPTVYGTTLCTPITTVRTVDATSESDAELSTSFTTQTTGWS